MTARKALLLCLPLVLTLGLAAACYGAPAGPAPTSPPATPPPGQAQVVMKDLAFQPQTLRIKAGTTVVWTNQDNFPHTVTSGANRAADGRFDSGNLGPGKTFQSTFTEAGTFPYFCRFHGGMNGTIEVE